MTYICEKTKTKGHYYKLSIGGKFAHDYTCKCKVHLQSYIENFATAKEVEKGVTVGKVIKPICKRCKKVSQTTQKNVTNYSAWEQSDGSIIVRI